MGAIDEKKLKIYELLYSNPMCKYIKERNGQKTLNVLIDLQDSDLKNEVFKAVYWCGQYPETILNITVIGNDDSFLNCFGHNKQFEKYATINLESDVSNVDLKNQDYSIVCYNYDTTNFLEGAFVYNIYNGIEEKETIDKELERIATNINISYALLYNPRCNVALEELKFSKYFESGEFIHEIGEKNKSSFVENVESSYAAAVHVTSKIEYCIIQYINKNTEIKDESSEYPSDYSKTNKRRQRIKLGIKAIKRVTNSGADKEKPNRKTYKEIFNDLIVLEHKRWIAYNLVKGIIMPSDEILDKYLFARKDGQGFYTHRFELDGIKYHACMCDCDNKGVILPRQSEYWGYSLDKINRLLENGELSKLNWVSLFVNLKLKSIVDENVEEYKNLMSKYINNGQGDIGYAIDMLLKRSDGALAIYEKVIKTVDKNTREELESSYLLSILKAYNNRVDFFKIDRHLIAMLPFCLSFDRDRTVVTLGKYAMSDVIVPTILMPKSAAFVANEINKYGEKVINYYKAKWGEPTKKEIEESSKKYIWEHRETKETLNIVSIIKCKENKSFALQNATRQIVEKYKNVIINVNSLNLQKAIAIGNHYDSTTIISYNSVKDSFSIVGDEDLKEFLPIKELLGFTIDEYFALIDENKSNDDKEADIKSNNLLYGVARFADDYYQLFDDGIWNTNIIYLIPPKNVKEDNALKIKLSMNGTAVTLFNTIGDFNKTDDILKLLRVFEKYNIISNVKIMGNHTTYEICNENFYNALTTSSGGCFELITYSAIYNSGVFNNLDYNIKIEWEDGSLKNEFDVVAIKSFMPLFVSCKAKKADKLETAYLHELAYWEKEYNCKGVFAIAIQETDKKYLELKKRAVRMGILIVGRDTLSNVKLLKSEIEAYLRNNK